MKMAMKEAKLIQPARSWSLSTPVAFKSTFRSTAKPPYTPLVAAYTNVSSQNWGNLRNEGWFYGLFIYQFTMLYMSLIYELTKIIERKYVWTGIYIYMYIYIYIYIYISIHIFFTLLIHISHRFQVSLNLQTSHSHGREIACIFLYFHVGHL